MKLKLLALSTMTLLTLTACGGGGSSSSNNNLNESPSIPNSTFQQWSTFELDSQSDVLSYESEKATIDNGKFYVLGNMDDSFSVTTNGLYDQGPLHNTYSYLNGNITINNNVWTVSPYSSVNSTGLRFANTMKPFNLEGENMAAKVDPYNHWILKNNLDDANNYISSGAVKYLTAISKVKFPAGATCLQLNKVTNTEQYLDLFNDTDNTYQEILADQWNDLSTDVNAKKYIMKDTIAYTITDEDESEYGVAQYKNRLYDAYLYQKGVEFDLQALIKSVDVLANAATNATEKTQILEFKKLVENSCSLYNEVAMNAIQQNFESNK